MLRSTPLSSAPSLLAKDAGNVPLWRAFVIVLVLAAGIVICLQWDRLIYKYKLLVGLRINQLRKIEEHEDMAGCRKMYHAEDVLYPRDGEGQPIPGKSLNISDRERWLPRVFIIVYLLFFTGFTIVLLFRA